MRRAVAIVRGALLWCVGAVGYALGYALGELWLVLLWFVAAVVAGFKAAQ